MKKTKLYIYSSMAVITAAMLVSSCADFLNVNTDPTRLKDALINQALTSAETSLAFYQGSDLYLYSSIWAQQGAGSGVSSTQTRLYDQYITTDADVNNAYGNYYAGSLADLDYVRKMGNSSKNPQYNAIARILQAYTFTTLVDAWGSVPYKDALKGVKNVQPKYDDSKEIYDSLFVLIDQGIANLKGTNVRPVGSDDLIYGGDMTKWEKFANTLKLRMALKYANVDGGALLNSIINSVTAGVGAGTSAGFMASNADNFQMAWANVTNRQNPIHQFELNRADYYAPSVFFVNLMNAKADPRRAFYFTSQPYPAPPVANGPPAANGTVFVGFTPGNPQTPPNSRIHTYLRGTATNDSGARTGGSPTATAFTYTGDAPQRMLTFAEYNFIRAEHALNYGGGGLATAQAFYTAGINASMSMAGVSGANAATYTAQPLGTLLAGAAGLQQIIEEKYVASYGIPMEAWCDWRRTGFPAISVSPAAAAVGNNTIPRILVYPLSEEQTNSANLPARQSMNVKGVFWDK